MFVVLVLCVLGFIYIYWQRTLYKNAPPPIYGTWINTFLRCAYFFLHKEDIWDKILTIQDDTKKVGGLAYFLVGFKRIYVVTNIDDINTILAKCNSKGFFYEFIRDWLGEGLLLAEPNNHKSRRKMVQPPFNPKEVNTFTPTINAMTANWIPQLKPLANGKPLDFAQHILKFTCNVFIATFSGVSGINYDYDAYLSAVKEMQEISIIKFETPIYHIDFFFNWSQHKERQIKSMKVIRNTIEEILKERKCILEKQAKENNTEIHSENKPMFNLLVELKDKGHYTEAQYLDELVNVLFAGIDTSAYTTFYILLLLGSHSDVQEKVYQELKNVFPEKIPENLDREDLEKLVYLDAVFKESMRLLPYVPLLGRSHNQDIQLKNYTIPNGSECVLMVYATQRDETWCEDPETFCPERWLRADSKGLNRALLPFGAGPYVCMGKYYALMTMKITFVHLLSAYRFRADWTQLKLKYEFFLFPKSGHHISMERRI